MLLCVALSGCSGGTSSSGPTNLGGRYQGILVVAGVSKAITITVTADGFVEVEVGGGGVVCIGDLPPRIGLDGDHFDATTSDQCFIGGLRCPLTSIVTGAISNKTITGSGSVLLACGNFTEPFAFSFNARLQQDT